MEWINMHISKIHTKFQLGKLKRIFLVKDMRVTLTSRNKVCGYVTVSYGSRFGPVVGSCEDSNELPDSIKGGKFLD
jgi:hypothetical protein